MRPHEVSMASQIQGYHAADIVIQSQSAALGNVLWMKEVSKGVGLLCM